ncbi:helix-turn-helix domain-containing protein [Breznakiellaceae bacterium SP9]
MKAGTINGRIRELRKALGLSQEAFSKGIKVSRAYTGFLERWGQPVNDRIISIICMVYKVNENWLREGVGAMFDTESDFRQDKVIQEFKKLDVELQDFILQQIDFLVDFQNKKLSKK